MPAGSIFFRGRSPVLLFVRRSGLDKGVSHLSLSSVFQETAEGRAGKAGMIASCSAPARAHALVSVPLPGRGGNLTKPPSALCYLCSRAENVFLFFPKKKLLLNLREMELCTPGKKPLRETKTN